MTKKKQNTEINPLAAAVAGAVIGAGVAVAGAAAMDEKNRDKVSAAFTKVKDGAVNYLNDVKTKSEEKILEVKDEVSSAKGKAKKINKVLKA